MASLTESQKTLALSLQVLRTKIADNRKQVSKTKALKRSRHKASTLAALHSDRKKLKLDYIKQTGGLIYNDYLFPLITLYGDRSKIPSGLELFEDIDAEAKKQLPHYSNTHRALLKLGAKHWDNAIAENLNLLANEYKKHTGKEADSDLQSMQDWQALVDNDSNFKNHLIDACQLESLIAGYDDHYNSLSKDKVKLDLVHHFPAFAFITADDASWLRYRLDTNKGFAIKPESKFNDFEINPIARKVIVSRDFADGLYASTRHVLQHELEHHLYFHFYLKVMNDFKVKNSGSSESDLPFQAERIGFYKDTDGYNDSEFRHVHSELLAYLDGEHFSTWFDDYRNIENKLVAKQSMFVDRFELENIVKKIRLAFLAGYCKQEIAANVRGSFSYDDILDRLERMVSQSQILNSTKIPEAINAFIKGHVYFDNDFFKKLYHRCDLNDKVSKISFSNIDEFKRLSQAIYPSAATKLTNKMRVAEHDRFQEFLNKLAESDDETVRNIADSESRALAFRSRLLSEAEAIAPSKPILEALSKWKSFTKFNDEGLMSKLRYTRQAIPVIKQFNQLPSSILDSLKSKQGFAGRQKALNQWVKLDDEKKLELSKEKDISPERFIERVAALAA